MELTCSLKCLSGRRRRQFLCEFFLFSVENFKSIRESWQFCVNQRLNFIVHDKFFFLVYILFTSFLTVVVGSSRDVICKHCE